MRAEGQARSKCYLLFTGEGRDESGRNLKPQFYERDLNSRNAHVEKCRESAKSLLSYILAT